MGLQAQKCTSFPWSLISTFFVIFSVAPAYPWQFPPPQQPWPSPLTGKEQPWALPMGQFTFWA